MADFPNEVQAISYSSNLQTQTKGDKFFLLKNIYYDGSGMTEQLAFQKFVADCQKYINQDFEIENGVPNSGFNFFLSFSSSRKSGNDMHFFGMIEVWTNTVTKIYTS